MIGYIIRRILIMIPTLLAISMIVFIIIELPPGDYLESYVAEFAGAGRERRSRRKLNSCASNTALTPRRSTATCVGSAACWWETSATPSSTGCRYRRWSATGLFLTILVSMATIIFTWIIAFPDRHILRDPPIQLG